MVHSPVLDSIKRGPPKSGSGFLSPSYNPKLPRVRTRRILVDDEDEIGRRKNKISMMTSDEILPSKDYLWFLAIVTVA